MKLKVYIEKWAGGILGIVSAILLLNLVLQFSGVRAAARRLLPSAALPAPAEKGKATPADDNLAQFDPAMRLDDLKRLDARPLPELSRNPFEFVLPPAPPTVPASPTAAAPAAPPAPPPISLHPMGYSEDLNGQKMAYVCDQSAPGPQGCAATDQVYIVHEGDTAANRYKILKITATAVTVEDETTHQTAELPIPQQ
jgi:hypothetical protein